MLADAGPAQLDAARDDVAAGAGAGAELVAAAGELAGEMPDDEAGPAAW
jgi:hypothetical protein